MTAFRRIWIACGVLLAVAGVIGLAGMQVSGVVLLAIAAGTLGAWAYAASRSHAERPASPRQIAWGGVCIAGCAVVGAGFIALAGGAGLLLLLLFGVCSPWSIARLDRMFRDREHRRRGEQPTPASPAPPAKRTSASHHRGAGSGPSALLRQAAIGSAPAPSAATAMPKDVLHLSDDELCLTWRRSFAALAKYGGPERSSIVDLRQACLDELQRRDPVGFARWLGAGARAASDPSRYLFAHDSYHRSTGIDSAEPHGQQQEQ